MVTVVRSLADHPSLAGALAAAGVAERRWPGFVTAISSLESSEIVRER